MVREAVLAAYGSRPPTKRAIVEEGPARDFYSHIELTDNYVPRAEVLAEIKAALLAPRTNGAAIALTSSIKMDALQGMGGIGKSVMARALCNDPEVQGAFPNGILWATLGEVPNLVERLREWVETLGGTVRSTAPTVDMLKAELQAALVGRTCLLILDDVWNKGDVGYFRPPAGSRLLLTMRDAALAEDLGATVQPIPVMDKAEALKLLQQSIGAGYDNARDVESSDRQASWLPAIGHHAGRPSTAPYPSGTVVEGV